MKPTPKPSDAVAMTDETPQILQKKPGEPGGEKARALIAAWKEWADWEMSPGTEAWWLNALAGALAACALEAERPLIEALTAIEGLVADDFCHDLSMRKLRGEKKLMAEKLTAIYRVAHACNPEHSCHHVHDDWRKEAHVLAAPAIAEREASRSVVEKAGKDLLGTLALERAAEGK